MHDITDAELETFWQDYIGNGPEVEASSLNQVFAKGVFAGYSIRDVMEACIHRLGKSRPKIVSDRTI